MISGKNPIIVKDSYQRRMPPKNTKVVIVGDTQVGKSCILFRYVEDKFNMDTTSTIGAAFFTKQIETGNGQIKLQLWDTAGQEDFRSLSPLYYRSASIAIIVFDLTVADTFKHVQDWMNEIREKAASCTFVAIVGNKCDLEDRVITTTDAKKAATAFGANLYAETSAKTGEGIKELFDIIAQTDVEGISSVNLTPAPVEKKKSCC